MEMEIDQRNTKNPLLITDILSEVFSYFEQDVKTLTTCREVCTEWNLTASPILKRAVTWKIDLVSLLPAGHTTTQSIQEKKRTEIEFLKLLAGTKNDILKKFHLKIPTKPQCLIRTVESQIILQEFLQTVGRQIIDLTLDASNTEHLNLILPHLPNLQCLKLCELAGETGGCSYQEISFPELRNVEFEVAETPQPAQLEQLGIIYCSVLENAHQLTSLAISDLSSIEIVLQCNNLTNLTSLELVGVRRVGNYTPLVAEHLRTIMSKCPNLKDFTASVRQFTDFEVIMEFISHFGKQLEKLNLFGGEEEVVGDQIYDMQTWTAECPVLKDFRLNDWHLKDNFNFPMPNLRNLNLCLVLGWSMPGIPPEPLLSKVRCLNTCGLIFGDMMGPYVIEGMGEAFPNLAELDVGFVDKSTLRAIYTHLPGLKRLSISNCKITDSGITGLTREQLATLAETSSNNAPKDPAALAALRTFPFIGDLRGLQYFYCKSGGITHASVTYGFAFLKELNTLRVKSSVNSALETLRGRSYGSATSSEGEADSASDEELDDYEDDDDDYTTGTEGSDYDDEDDDLDDGN